MNEEVIFGLSNVIEAIAKLSAKEKGLVESLPESWRGEASKEYGKILTELYNLDNLHSLLVQFKDELQKVYMEKVVEQAV